MTKGRKRPNPETGKPFKKGDLRHDGAKFIAYTKIVKKDDTFREQWKLPPYSERKTGTGDGLFAPLLLFYAICVPFILWALFVDVHLLIVLTAVCIPGIIAIAFTSEHDVYPMHGFTFTLISGPLILFTLIAHKSIWEW